MNIKIYNTLTNKKEEIIPLHKGHINMYVCGPTVYHYIHVGNARPMVFFDVVFRYLRAAGFKVTYVRNITDIDDKIIKRANDEKKTASEIANTYSEAFEDDMKKLGVESPSVSPKASEHIKEMVEWIKVLIEKGVAYEVKGEVFFSIEKFKSYGKLSKKNKDELQAGARVEVAKHKKSPLDFVLWKPSKAGEPKWESPWGEGRPGWHLECSVMSTKYLGQTFDIHGGGIDLIFPHHENETAQSESMSGRPFVKYWMHNDMIAFGKEKMSKSLGNIVTVHDFLKQYPAEVLRYLLLSNHYRSQLEFSKQAVKESILALQRVYTTLLNVNNKISMSATGAKGDSQADAQLRDMTKGLYHKFDEAMKDDFNTAEVIGGIFTAVRAVNKFLDTPKMPNDEGKRLLTAFCGELRKIGNILGLFQQEPNRFLMSLNESLLIELNITKEKITSLIQERLEARKVKNWKRADEIRDELKKSNIVLKDSPLATTWTVEL